MDSALSLRSKPTSLIKDPLAAVSVVAWLPPTPTTSKDVVVVASPPTEVLPLWVSASSAETRTELPPLTRASTTSPVDSVSRSSRCIPKSSKTEVVELL